MKKVILGVLLTICMLAACGQKGNLYLPEPAPASTSSSIPAK